MFVFILLNKNWSIGFDDDSGSSGGGGGGIVGSFELFPDANDDWRIAKNFPSGVRMYEPRDALIRCIRTPAGICSRSDGFNWTSKAKHEPYYSMKLLKKKKNSLRLRSIIGCTDIPCCFNCSNFLSVDCCCICWGNGVIDAVERIGWYNEKWDSSEDVDGDVWRYVRGW